MVPLGLLEIIEDLVLHPFPSRVYFLHQKGWLLGHAQQWCTDYLWSVRLGARLTPTLNVQSLKRRGWLSWSNPVMTITSVRPQSKSPFSSSSFVLLYFEYCAVGGSITSVIDYCLSAALFFFCSAQESFLFVLMMWWRVFVWSAIWWFYHMWG